MIQDGYPRVGNRRPSVRLLSCAATREVFVIYFQQRIQSIVARVHGKARCSRRFRATQFKPDLVANQVSCLAGKTGHIPPMVSCGPSPLHYKSFEKPPLTDCADLIPSKTFPIPDRERMATKVSLDIPKSLNSVSSNPCLCSPWTQLPGSALPTQAVHV